MSHSRAATNCLPPQLASFLHPRVSPTHLYSPEVSPKVILAHSVLRRGSPWTLLSVDTGDQVGRATTVRTNR